MPALPSATTATASSATEGNVKNYLIGLRDYLNGLLGATGNAADARAALGVTPLTYASLVAALGYTPANSANAATDHDHRNMAHNAVGSLCFAIPVPATTYNPGDTLAGSSLRAAGVLSADAVSGGSLVAIHGSTLSGTWRCLGFSQSGGGGSGVHTATLWMRYV